MRSSSRSPIASPRAHPVLLHRCVTNRMGSQLADSSSLRTVVTSWVLPTYQLAGTRSNKIVLTSVGTSAAQSDCSSILWQQYGSCLHSQTRRNSFHLSVQQDTEIISSSGSVCDSSHFKPSARSLECDSGCPASNQQPQSYRLGDSQGNLTQSVLCLRDLRSAHVRHRREQGDPSLCFTLPGQQSLGDRRPFHILGWLRPSLRFPSSSNNPQNPPGFPTAPQWSSSLPNTRLGHGIPCYSSSAFVLTYRWQMWPCTSTFPTFAVPSPTEILAHWM